MLSGAGTIALTSSSTYWVAALPGATDTSAVWENNAIGATGVRAYNLGSGWVPGDDGVNGAFDVLGATGAAVPEPAAWALMLVGFGLMGAGLRAYRGRVRLPDAARVT